MEHRGRSSIQGSPLRRQHPRLRDMVATEPAARGDPAFRPIYPDSRTIMLRSAHYTMPVINVSPASLEHRTTRSIRDSTKTTIGIRGLASQGRIWIRALSPVRDMTIVHQNTHTASRLSRAVSRSNTRTIAAFGHQWIRNPALIQISMGRLRRAPTRIVMSRVAMSLVVQNLRDRRLLIRIRLHRVHSAFLRICRIR